MVRRKGNQKLSFVLDRKEEIGIRMLIPPKRMRPEAIQVAVTETNKFNDINRKVKADSEMQNLGKNVAAVRCKKKV